MIGQARFLHVGFNWIGNPKVTELEGVFNSAIDWIRYAPNCWILRTTTDPDIWLARVKPYMTENDQVFICELNTSSIEKYSGWLSPWMWPRIQNPKK